jgi:head-tail adaptor
MKATFTLDDKVTIEKPTKTRDPVYKAPVHGWEVVAADIWANVQDSLPSRGETVTNGLATSTKATRLRVRKHHMLAPDMRVTLHGRFGDRVMRIVSGPALLDDREHIECMLQGYTG